MADIVRESQEPSYVQVPRELLFDPKLTPSRKVVWMVLQFHSKESNGRPSYTRVAREVGISRPTVYKAVRDLAAAGWHPFRAPEPAAQVWVRIPAHLVTDGAIPAAAKVMYGLLQALKRALRPELKGSGDKTRPKTGTMCLIYSSFAKLINWNRKAVAKAVRALAAAGWLAFERENRRVPAYCVFKDPRLAASEAEVERMKRRLSKAEFKGEAIMREYLTMLVDSEQYEDNASPGFLVNPLTDERLQLDRYYPPAVAFEFNGPQHYAPTERYSAETVAQQRVRDLIKLGICASRGITLKIVHAEDLTLARMREIVGQLLPLRDLRYEGPRIAYLEQVARQYRRSLRRGEQSWRRDVTTPGEPVDERALACAASGAR